jgi:FAD/FMN-containing dehydrogenase
VQTVVAGMLMLPATPQVIASFVAEAQAAPDELSTVAMVMSAMPMPSVPAEHHGRLVLMALMCYAGPTRDGERVIAPFRALAAPIVDHVQPTRYPELFPTGEQDYHPTVAARTLFMDHVDHDVAATILQSMHPDQGGMRAVQLRVLGGAMARVPVQATAFAHRRCAIMANVAAFYDDPAELPARTAWVDDVAAALRQADGGVYVNFLGDDGETAVRAAYPGPTWDRLAAIKARYDPTNLFRFNHNIPPATASSVSSNTTPGA